MAYVDASVLTVLAVWIALNTQRDFARGVARFDFWWTYPKLEASQSDEQFGFWLIVLSKVGIAGAVLFFAANLVRTA